MSRGGGYLKFLARTEAIKCAKNLRKKSKSGFVVFKENGDFVLMSETEYFKEYRQYSDIICYLSSNN